MTSQTRPIPSMIARNDEAHLPGCRLTMRGSDAFSRDESVLIVSDQEEGLEALRALFRVESFKVVAEVSSGVEAIALAMTRPLGYIVLDCRMPLLDGERASRLLRMVAPRARIVALFPASEMKPVWADAYLGESHIRQTAPALLESLEIDPTGSRRPQSAR